MRYILSLSLMIFAGQLAIGQNDPSYSVHNYKHPNKAEYAKNHKTDNSTSIEVSDTAQNDNYKQSFQKTKATKKHAVKVEEGKNPKNVSYKHPYGL